MKKLFLILLIFLCAVSLFAKRVQERKLTILYSGPNPPAYPKSQWEDSVEKVMAKFPGLTVEFQKIDLSTGAPVTMDTLIASGMAPDIYNDAMVRLSRYIIPEFALPLDEYMDLKGYLGIEPLTKGGKVLALPHSGSAQAMCLNLDLLDKVGYKVPDNWTLDDFLEMCAKVKAYSDKTGEDVYGTGLFAGNQSGDYLWMNWFAVFGVKLYDADFTESTQAKGGEKVWAFFKMLKDKGYVQANSAALNDDDYALDWSKGKFAATAFFPSWNGVYFKSAMEQGLIKAPHRYVYVAFPNKAPSATSYSGFVINKNSKEREAAVELVRLMTTVEKDSERVRIEGLIAYREGSTAKPNDPHVAEVDSVVKANGLYDLGVSNSWFSEVRAQGFPILQAVLNGKLTPAQAAVEYSKKVNEIIK